MIHPKVTVMVITYNHSKYIAGCLDSILAQNVDFPIAVHVIDDCSTDGAQDIIRDYAARYPGVIKPFINAKNIGRKVTQRNFYRGFKTLDGDYIAILEGDDYWTSPDKLKFQIDFLEANPKFVACAHYALKVYEDGSAKPHVFLPSAMKEEHGIEDLISIQSFFHTSTLTYRNVFRGRVPKYFKNPSSHDVTITIAHAQYGPIYFKPDIWSVYLAHGGGMFSGMKQAKGWMFNIDGLRKCNRWLRFRHFAAFSQAIYRYCEYLLEHGTPENGLSRYNRLRYAALGKAYKWLNQAHRKLGLRGPSQAR